MTFVAVFCIPEKFPCAKVKNAVFVFFLGAMVVFLGEVFSNVLENVSCAKVKNAAFAFFLGAMVVFLGEVFSSLERLRTLL